MRVIIIYSSRSAVLLLCCVLLMLASTAQAQPRFVRDPIDAMAAGAYQSTRPGELGSNDLHHAWLVTADGRGGGATGAIIWHVPPRGSVIELGVQPGAVRLAGDVHAMPTAIAAVGDRLYMFFDDRPKIPPAKPRSVLSVTAVAAGAQRGLTGTQAWVTRPLGRYNAEPALRSDGELIAATGTEDSVLALMHGLREKDDDPKAVTLYKLVVRGSHQNTGARWQQIMLPAEITGWAAAATRVDGNRVSMPSDWVMFPVESSLLIAARPPLSEDPLLPSPPGDRGQWRWWVVSSRVEKPSTDATTVIEGGKHNITTKYTLTSSGSLATLGSAGSPVLLGTKGGLLFATVKNDDSLQLLEYNITSSAAASSFASGAISPVLRGRLPQSTSDITTSGTGMLVGSQSRTANAVVIGGVASTNAQRIIGDGRSLSEVSLATGRVMFKGELTPQSPVTIGDYRMLGLLMALTMATALAFLGKRPGDVSVSLPDSSALASSISRTLASLIDVISACVIGTALWKVPLSSLWDIVWWGSATSLWTLVTIVFIGIVLNALLESFSGRSLGKIFAGICVVRGYPLVTTARDPYTRAPKQVPQRLPLRASLLRNVFKWLSPLVAIAGIFSLSRRHRGDEWAKSCVVEFIFDESEEDDTNDNDARSSDDR